MQQDFRVKSGIYLNGNITGAQNVTVTYTGSFGNLFVSGKIYGNVEGTVSTLSNFTTANLAENNSALYYTNSRVVSAVTPILTTANVVEKNNLYFTQERVTPLLTTANVVETTNQYFTNTRVLQAVEPKLTTANVIEKDNLYFTAQRAIDALAGNNVTVNNLTVSGDLEIQGNTVSVNTATLTIEDKNIIIANGAVNYAQADGAGITIAGANATITYVSADDELRVNKDIAAQANVTIAGTLDVVGNVNFNSPAFIDEDPIITLDPMNQSIALLKSYMDRPLGNVIFVAGTGDDRNSGNSVANALANIHTALNRAQPWTTVFVKSGDYILYEQPVTIKRRVGLVGDNLRTTTVRPAERTKDMFYVNNASYVTGFTFRDHLSPSAVFSYNPDGSAGFISTSPYIQNSSSITTTGTGMRVDGNYVTGLRSMVCDSYTQTNEGGIGIHMLNRGYTQLVSVFTICCDIAILCENGGFCSITNSNASFGRLGLVARGVSQPLNFGTVVGPVDTDEGTKYLIKGLDKRPNYGDAVLIANYNKEKCARDTGLIVDALALDLAYQGNTQSAFAGLQYWAQLETAIPGQADETIAAFTYAKNLATNVAANLAITAPMQANVSQTRGVAGGWLNKVSDGFDLVANIITGGTLGVTDRIVTNSFPANTNVDVNNTANLILSNKSFIQKEVVAYVNQTYPGFFANSSNFVDGANALAKCERDTGYLIDSIVFDLLHGGNRQAIMSGVYYYNQDYNTTQIANQVPQTTAAYDFIGTIVEKIIKNKKIGNYDQEKCERDTGLIVDSLLFDLAYGSNTQSVFSGLQYWSQTESAIQHQAVETTAAINLAKRLATNVAANIAITSTYQANVAQVRGLPGTQVSRVADEFDLIVDIINNGTVGVTDRIIPNIYPANSDVTAHHTANLLVLNKDFIAAEVIAYVNQTYPGFFANANNFLAPLSAANTCSRDVGFILDSIAFDIRHDGNRQAIQSGVYYYNYSANVTQINDQIVKTGMAYDIVGEIISSVVKNKKYASYNQEKCERDTGLIVDSIALDLLYPGSSQSTFAGLQYWAQTESAIPNQSEETLAAINFVKNTSANIMLGTYSGDYQNNVAFTTGAADGTGYSSGLLNAKIDLVANIITGGTVGVTDRIIPNGLYNTSNVNLNTAANLVIANKAFIAAETLAYVNQTYPGFFANSANFIDAANAEAICSRDVGYILDSAIFDVLHGGNKQSVQAGTYYYTHNTNVTQINDQIVKTGQAYEFIGSLINSIIVGEYNREKCRRDAGLIVDALAFDLAYQGNTEARFAGLQYWAQTTSDIPNQSVQTLAAIDFVSNLAANAASGVTLAQVYQANVSPVNGAAGTIAEKTTVDTLTDLLYGIVNTGTSGVTDLIVSNQYPPSANVNINNAANAIIANKSFIAAETIGFINTTYPGWFANASHFIDPANAITTCSRDVGYILDSVAFDLKHGGNKQTITAGTYYYNYSAESSQINDQVVRTGAAYNFMGTILDEIVTATAVATVRQNTVAQNTTAASAATLSQAYAARGSIELINNIITNGPTVAGTKTPISLNGSNDTNIVNAAKLILANKQFIVEETISYIDELVYGVRNQTDVLPYTSYKPATSSEAANVTAKITLINNIIANGPTVAPAKTPISLTVTTNTNVKNAANLIILNRDFIKAETVAYINKVMWDAPYQSEVKQNTIAYPAATQAEANQVLNNISLIKTIITNGPNAAPSKRPIIYNTSATSNVSNAAKIILANKNYIKAETLAYINKELFDAPYQSEVKQNTTAAAAATIAEANIILRNINLITDIIESGQSAAPAKRPISYSSLSTNANVINAAKILIANKPFITAEVSRYIDRDWANISNGTVAFYTVANSTPLVGNTSLVLLLEGDTDTTIIANSIVSFHQPSYISGLGYTFEYIGSGTSIQTALPYNGGVPIQANEVTEEGGGRVYFTSTDQQGDFRIGTELVFNRVDGTISGRTFNKALFAVMTPYILAIEG